MSWFDGLLIGLGNGVQRAVPTYLEEKERRRRAALEDQEIAERRMTSVDRMMRDRDEFEERKRSNRKQEELEHERNVQSSLDRMVARENGRYAADEATRRAIEVATLRAQVAREEDAGKSARASQHHPAASPDGLTANQRNGLTYLNAPSPSTEARHEWEAMWRRAREAFPNAHPGDVAMAAQRMYDRMARERAAGGKAGKTDKLSQYR